MQEADVASLHDELHALAGSLTRLHQLLPADAAADSAPAEQSSLASLEQFAQDLTQIVQVCIAELPVLLVSYAEV